MSEKGAATATAPGDRVAIGIAIGNSNSSIAFTVDDKAEVIANEDGDRQIPTILSYVDGDEYYGLQAKNFLIRNPTNTIAYFRDFLGQEFKSIDPTHCHAAAHPEDKSGTVSFTVRDKVAEEGEEVQPSTLSVSEVATRYIRRLVGSASEYLGKTVTSAVITVPTNFNDKQREALTAAANAAGIEVLQLISEPTAAVLAYDARPEAQDGGDVMVRVVEGNTHIKVTKPEPKPQVEKKPNGVQVEDAKESGDEDSDDDSDEDSDEEEEEKREKVWKTGDALAEAAIRGVKKGSQIEVTINVMADLGVTVTAREVGAKGGVRGTL
ncbi:hsp70-like protein [Magnaporthiopsis poae ATCC 64411]|uniref:Hsp70-like protein n=1 Tax=Magnaporthiopsis poae (strain ATCC 64411 / 73-15) TaxID=644358 RepID=A0A0C4DQ51_MAGP6|nr:hsp70-like protein [Magnaporthiopsis poae ATCC 64411]